jgi:hypothetical protein
MLGSILYINSLGLPVRDVTFCCIRRSAAEPAAVGKSNCSLLQYSSTMP